MNLSHGPFYVDVYWGHDEAGNSNVNDGAVGIKSRTAQLINDSYWINPMYTKQECLVAAKRMISGMEISPLETKSAFIGPDIPGMPHKILLDATCERIYEFLEGTEDVFTIPYREHFKPESTRMDVNGRVFVGPLRFPVCIWYKDALSVPKIDKMTLLHARTHMNRTTTQYYINNGLDVAGIKLNMSDTNYNSDHCALCIKANMRKPHVGSANRDVTIYEVFEYFGLDFH